MSDSRMPGAEAIAGRLRTLVPDATVEPAPSLDDPVVYVSADQLLAACQALYDDADFRFELLVDVVGVDYWPREPRFEVVYHLVSVARAARVRLKVRVPGDDPHVPSVGGVWPASGFLEREVWDLFGIVFDGHGDLRRLLMPDDWEGYPLRKDYPVQISLKPTVGEPLQLTEQEFRANIQADRARRG